LVGQFWGLNTDRILEPFLRKVVLSQNGSPHGVYRHAQIQVIFGHESKKSLEIYQHLSLGAVEQAYQEAVQGVSI
jgi:hypothetical protein